MFKPIERASASRGDRKVKVRVWLKDDDGDIIDEATETVEIPSDDEEQEIAVHTHEHDTEKIVVMDGKAYYMHPNGGEGGAWDRQCGDGEWRDYPVKPTRLIDRSEARRLMLDWGNEPAEVACATRMIH